MKTNNKESFVAPEVISIERTASGIICGSTDSGVNGDRNDYGEAITDTW